MANQPIDSASKFRPFRAYDWSPGAPIATGDNTLTDQPTGLVDLATNLNTIYALKDYSICRCCTPGSTNASLGTSYVNLYFNSFYMPDLAARNEVTVRVEYEATADVTFRVQGGTSTVTSASTATGSRQTEDIDVATTVGAITDFDVAVKKTTSGTASITVYNVSFFLKKLSDVPAAAFDDGIFYPQDPGYLLENAPVTVETGRQISNSLLGLKHEFPRTVCTYFELFNSTSSTSTSLAATSEAGNDEWDLLHKAIYYRRSPEINAVDIWLTGWTDGWVGPDSGATIRVSFDGADSYVDVSLDSATIQTAHNNFQANGISLFIPPGPGPHHLTVLGQADPDSDNPGYVWAMTIRESVTWPIL